MVAVLGSVASDPTVSRLSSDLAASGARALSKIRAVRTEVRQQVWQLAKNAAPGRDGQVIIYIGG